MARKAKAGKKFKYGLEAVLKVRGIREKQEQEKFATKQRDYLTEKEKEDLIRDKKHGEEETIRKTIRKGPISNFEKVMRRHAHLGILKEDLDKQIDQVIQATKKLEEQRDHLITAMKDKKIIEKNKENRFKDYKHAMQLLEIKFLDEIATERFRHEQHES
ncbi:MAG: flagellar FliJ family protein [Candidatus Saganbacteria bacterium]|nr:flagellar FliJ family protein [Candidatus Saganbacteria bacterium]